jgi:hypothetical protein
MRIERRNSRSQEKLSEIDERTMEKTFKTMKRKKKFSSILKFNEVEMILKI